MILSGGIRKSTPIEMVSVLSGFFVIFIGVFMVNDAKATSEFLIEKAASRRSSRNHSSVIASRAIGEFHLLQTFNQDGGNYSEDDNLGETL